MRIVSRQKAVSRKTVNDYVHRITASTKDSKFIKEKFNPKWNGVLSIDGKYIKVYDPVEKGTVKYCWICGIDFPSKDLPHYLLAEEEGKIDLVMYFKKLKELDYPLKVLISDDNHNILEAARFVYGSEFKFQLCTRHYLEKLESLSSEENNFLVELIRKIVYSKDEKSLCQRLTFLMNNKHCFVKRRYEREIFKDFQEHVEYLITHIRYPKYIPRTNNEIENLFRQLNLRLKTIGRFYHHKYASDYLNAWALMRRFTPFTDCRQHNKYKNGKAPLELAGCDIKGIDYLKL